MKNASVLSVVLAVSAVFTVSAETVTYDLTQRDSAYLQKTSTVIASWTNRNLADVTSIKGVMQGGFNPTPAVVRGVIYDRTADGFSVQFQLVNEIGNINKVLRAHFRQDGTSIVGWADRCGSSADLKSSPQPFGYILTEEELPYTNVSTDGTTQRYGVRDIEIFGDVVQTITEVPSAENEIQVKGGVLGIAVENGQTIANAISGDGGVAFIGTVSEEQGSMGDDAFIGTADTVVARGCDISGLDTSSLTAWLDGSYLSAQPPTEAVPVRNVVWADNRLSFTAQFQYGQHFTGFDLARGALVEFSQSGADIVAKVLKVGQVSDSDPATRGTDRYLGTDMQGKTPQWTFAEDKYIVTGAGGTGIGVRTVAYRAKKINRVTLSGTKTWTGRTFVDGASVNMTGSYFANNSEVTVRNGGILDLAADGTFKKFRYISYRVSEGSFLRCRGNFAIDNGDKLVVDGGTVVYVDNSKNAYFNDVTLLNGGTVIGGDGIGIAYQESSTWHMIGDSPISVGVPIRLTYYYEGTMFTVNADTDLTFTGSVKSKSTFEGLPLRKRGAAKVTFGVGADIPKSPVLLEAGTLAFLSNSSVKSLALTGTGTIEVAAGATLAIGDSSSRSWSGTGILEFFEADRKSIRFGASASALTAAQLSRIRLNGSSAKLDANGYLVRDAGLVLLFR